MQHVRIGASVKPDVTKDIESGFYCYRLGDLTIEIPEVVAVALFLDEAACFAAIQPEHHPELLLNVQYRFASPPSILEKMSAFIPDQRREKL